MNVVTKLAPGVSVIIPSIPPRVKSDEGDYPSQALDSASGQTLPSGGLRVHMGIDWDREGSSIIRNRLIELADTEWLAFLDDDDLFLPGHLGKLLAMAQETNADLVYPWFHIIGPNRENLDHRDPLRIDGKPAFGHPFNERAREIIETQANFIPVTVIVRTELVRDVGGFPVANSEEWPHPQCVDWGLWRKLLAAGASFAHLPERTWQWRWHGANTSGRTDRW